METQIMNEEYKAMHAKALEQLRSGQSLTGKDEAVSKKKLGRSFFLHFSHFFELGFYLDLILDSESE